MGLGLCWCLISPPFPPTIPPSSNNHWAFTLWIAHHPTVWSLTSPLHTDWMRSLISTPSIFKHSSFPGNSTCSVSVPHHWSSFFIFLSFSPNLNNEVPSVESWDFLLLYTWSLSSLILSHSKLNAWAFHLQIPKLLLPLSFLDKWWIIFLISQVQSLVPQ